MSIKTRIKEPFRKKWFKILFTLSAILYGYIGFIAQPITTMGYGRTTFWDTFPIYTIIGGLIFLGVVLGASILIISLNKRFNRE